ncbi:MAG TPA: hypothetical protein VJ876_04190 [Bacteroidales bacterium]|nr:hypothetical protein [Bacteroidales bacterium]
MRVSRSIKRWNILSASAVVSFLVLFVSLSANAQEKIEEKLFQRDSLIQRVGLENIDTSYTYEWNKDSSRWELFGRDLEFYRANQKLLARLEQKWQPGQLQYTNSSRTIKSYDEKGQVVESLNQRWDTSRQDWVNLELKTITYDDAGNKSEILYQEWRKAVGRWISATRYLIDYNRKGERSNIMIRRYKPETDSWANYQRYIFRYKNGYGHPDEALVQRWDLQSDQWEKQGLYTMRYNFRGKKTFESRATWNESLRKWINGIRYRFNYKKNLKVAQVMQRWDYGTRKWYNAVQKRFKYDENEELKEELTFRWNKDTEQWVLKNRLLYSRKKPEPVKEQKKESDPS